MSEIEKRKADHIEVTLEEKVFPPHDFWDDIRLVHDSLPEVDLEKIDTSVWAFGKKLSFPMIVTAITGGYSKAQKINRNLAEACSEVGIGLGVGSQRAALESGDRKSYEIVKDFEVPLVIGNVGAPQLIEQRGKRSFDDAMIKEAISMIDADLLAVHLNFLQEIAQPEGDTNSVGCTQAIRDLAKDYPILVKETGAGISKEVALRLKGIGIRGLDVSGTGGTSFSLVEAFRAQRKGDARYARIGETFSTWGIPSPVSVMWADVGLPIIASGGINNGLQAAKSVVLGACCAGTARSVLKEAMESADAVVEKLQIMKDEFTAAMFLTGSANVKELGNKDHIIIGETQDWLSSSLGKC